MVPSKGLEPPHPCEYMDLNHARLPIPPRWQYEPQCSGGLKAAESGRPTVLFYSPITRCQTTDFLASAAGSSYPSFAVIVILAFSTFDTGHPFSAASAYF